MMEDLLLNSLSGMHRYAGFSFQITPLTSQSPCMGSQTKDYYEILSNFGTRADREYTRPFLLIKGQGMRLT